MERIYELKIDLPFLPKGAKYSFDYEMGWVYRWDKGERFEYPLREELAKYLWLLKTEGNTYLKEVNHV
jgi:hypothetical protein